MELMPLGGVGQRAVPCRRSAGRDGRERKTTTLEKDKNKNKRKEI